MATVTEAHETTAAGNRMRIIDAALACVTRSGTRKLTIDDIASQARVSRATIYRTFDGGRDAILSAAVETEVARFFSTMAAAMGRAHDLSELTVTMLTVSATYLSNHQTLTFLRSHEPETVFTHLTFGRIDATLEAATLFAAPFFVQWLEPEEASRAAELVVRIVVSHLTDPDPAFDLQDVAAVTAFVDTFVVAALVAPMAPRSRRIQKKQEKGRSS